MEKTKEKKVADNKQLAKTEPDMVSNDRVIYHKNGYSMSIRPIHVKLSKIIHDIGTVNGKKKGYNFEYTDPALIKEAVVEALRKNKVTHTFSMVGGSLDVTQGLTKGKSTEELYIAEFVHTITDSETGDSLSVVMPSASQGVNGQGIGGMLTYTERQFYEKQFKVSVKKHEQEEVKYTVDKDGEATAIISNSTLEGIIEIIRNKCKTKDDYQSIVKQVIDNINADHKPKTAYDKISNMPEDMADDIKKAIAVAVLV